MELLSLVWIFLFYQGVISESITAASDTDNVQKKILFQGMHASDSHIASSMPYALRFHREGHYVEFLETHEKPQPYNYPLGINNTYIQLESKHSYEALFRAVWRNYFGAQVFSSVFLVGENVLRQIFETQRAEIEKFLEKKYDLLIIDEIFSILGYGLGLKRREEGIPFLTMASCASTDIMQHHLSLGNNFITRPSYFGLPTKQFDPARFSSRLDTFWESVSDLLLVEHALQNHAQEGVKNLGLAGFEYKDIARKTSFYLYDEITFLVGSETLLVGFHCAKFATLSGEYLEHVEHPGSKGTILIAFGTNVKWEFAPAELILAFVDALNSLPEFRVIWTYNGLPEHVKDLKSHVLLTKWAPQKEILKHEKTVAFVSHGGMKSVKDTICAGVPVVFMPILAEQSLNAEMCRQAGFGVTLAKTEVTVEKLRDALLTVTEPSYKAAMLKFQSFYFDRPIDSLDHATWAVNRAMAVAPRFPTFKRRGMDLTYREHYHFEIVSVMLLGIVLLTL